MAISFVAAWAGVQNVFPSPPQSLTTASADTTGANLLVAVFTNDTNAGLSISDSKGNTWNVLFGPTQNATGDYLTVAYSVPSSVGTGHTLTVTANAANNFLTLSAAAYSGIDPTPLDKTTSGTGSGTALDSGSTATTTVASELVIGAGTQSGASLITWTAGSGFTIRSHVDNAAVGGVSVLEDKTVSATGTYNATITSDQSNNWTCVVATFKAAAAASVIKKLMLLGMG